MYTNKLDLLLKIKLQDYVANHNINRRQNKKLLLIAIYKIINHELGKSSPSYGPHLKQMY